MSSPLKSIIPAFLLSACVLLTACGSVSDEPGTEAETKSAETGQQTVGSVITPIESAVKSTVTVECTFTSGTKAIQTGSAVVWKKSGSNVYLLTCYHVTALPVSGSIASPAKITVSVFGSGVKFEATRVGFNRLNDTAVLCVDSSTFSALVDTVTCRPGDIRFGEPVYAVGNTDGKGISVTDGCISVPAEVITVTDIPGETAVTMREIRSGANASDGASGGGLFDANGYYIGMLNAYNEDGVCAIPANVVCTAAERILSDGDGGQIPVLQFGISVIEQNLHPVSSPSGALTAEATLAVTGCSGGSAASVILKQGDVLLSLSIGGAPPILLNRTYQLTEALMTAKIGDTLTFSILRNGIRQVLSVRVSEMHFLIE